MRHIKNHWLPIFWLIIKNRVHIGNLLFHCTWICKSGIHVKPCKWRYINLGKYRAFLVKKNFSIKRTHCKKMKYFIKDFFSKWPSSQFLADLITFTEEILNGKLHFLCSDWPCWSVVKVGILTCCLECHFESWIHNISVANYELFKGNK